MSDLAPIEEGELYLLSNNHMVVKKKSKHKTNIMTTVYNEPVVAYFTKLDSDLSRGVIVAYSADKEFSYLISGGIIEIFINELPFARMHNNGLLTDRNNKPIARLDYKHVSHTHSISLFNRNVAELRKPLRKSITEKAYLCVDSKNKQEEDLILAISLPRLILAMAN